MGGMTGAASRRGLLAGAMAAGAAAGLPAWAEAATGERQVAGFEPKLVPSAAQLGRWLKQLHDFGPVRATGTRQARAFEDFLARELAALGFQVQRDPFRLTSWECDLDRDCAISVTEDGKAPRELDVVAYYPFAASTRGKGPVSGRVLYAGSGEEAAKALVAKTDPAVLAKSIVVVDMPLTNSGYRSIPKLYPETFPPTLPRAYDGPNPAAQGGRPSMEAVQGKCQGLILCFTDVSNEAGRYNYLPFSDVHRRTPSLWVGAEDGSYLRSVSGRASLTLRCDATLTPDARSDTIVATLPGPSDEVVFLTTQTDGPNECNENGGLGVLALATYAAKLPKGRRKRTLVCSLPTGHYALGAVMDPKTGSGKRPGTSGVMAMHPEITKRIVGQISLEQMGAREWSAAGGKWQATGLPAPERWIPTPAVAPTINRVFHAATVGEEPAFTRAVLVESGAAPGEGGAPRAAGLPGIGLMGGPQYFFRADPRGVLDKLDPRIMKNEVDIATKMMVLMDRLSADQLYGRAPISEADLFG
jgi:hypothetical protein